MEKNEFLRAQTDHGNKLITEIDLIKSRDPLNVSQYNLGTQAELDEAMRLVIAGADYDSSINPKKRYSEVLFRESIQKFSDPNSVMPFEVRAQYLTNLSTVATQEASNILDVKLKTFQENQDVLGFLKFGLKVIPLGAINTLFKLIIGKENAQYLFSQVFLNNLDPGLGRAYRLKNDMMDMATMCLKNEVTKQQQAIFGKNSGIKYNP
jgi:hypothetical protein